MAFNIFGRPKQNDIRVGYIDPDGGFIDGLTVCDANLHAKNNPGTTFIFRTRECIKYLNINEVNALTPNDLIGSSGTLGCEGIQLDIASSDLDLGDLFSLDTNQVARSPRSVYGESIGGSSSGKKDKKCGPLKVNFFGGGGVGVQGNPIVGTDGSLLAVDLIRGGYGYQYAPLTKVEDNCGRGVGSVVRSIIGISSARGFQYYDAFEDFEDYQLCVSDEAPAVPKFSTDGSIVGIWDPRVYASLNEDPIRRQIKEYQEFLQQLTKPWWTTQKEAPLKVTSSPKIAKGYNNSRSLINVTDGPYRARQKALGRLEGAIGAGHIWNDFMNKYAVSPVPPSNAVGSDFGTFDFQFEWEEDFPYDGIYTIRGCGDGEVKDLWILPDGEEATSDNKLMTLAGYNQKPVKKKRNYKAGVHRILIALRNGQQFKEIQEEVVVSEEVTETINTVTRTYPIDYKGLNPSNDPIRVKDNGRRIELKDSDKNDANATFRIISTSSGVNARFSSDGRSLEVQGSGNVTIRLEWDDNPFKYDVAVESISVANKTWTQKGKSGKETETIQVTDAGGAIPGSNRPEEKVYRIEVAERESRGRGKFAGVKSVSDRKIKFTDSSSKVQPIAAQDDTDAEFEILNPSPGIQYAKFRGSNDNDLELVVKGSGTITLRLSWKDDPGRNGKAVGNLKVAGAKFNQRGRKGKDTEVIKIDTNVRVAGGTVSETSRTRVVAPRVTKLVSKKVPTRAPWNDNPMGVSVTIDAPLPPILQEPIPPSEDECPPNPFWTTRYPAKDRWWPVNYSDAMAAAGVTKWSDFLSRYAISPVPPLIEEDTDGSGRLWTNTWEIDAPYDGFYQFAVQRDETARIFLDGNLVFDVTTAGDAIWKNLRNKPKLQKVFIKKGKHTINIELSQERFETYTWVDAKIFRTRDWQEAAKPTGAKTVDVNFQVTTSAKFANGVELVGEFAVRKTHGGPQLNESRTRRIETGRVYDVIFKTRGTTSSSRSVQKGIPIEVAEPGSRGRGPLAVIKSVSDSRIRFTDSKFQMDTDASFRILRKDGPDYARFSNDGSQLIVKGKGTVTLELEWDDDKSRNGKAVGNIKVAGEAFRQTGNSGKVTKTINVDATEVSGGQSARAKLKNSGNNVIRMEDSKDSDYNDLVITSSLGRFFDIRGNRCKFMVDFAHSSNANKVVTRKGGDVTYTGPEIFHFKHPAWSTFMNNHSVSPYLPPIDQNNPEINATKRYTWSNVNFPVDGQYKIAFQADNFAKLFIGGVHVATAKQFNGNVVIDGFNMDAGVYDIVVEAGNTADSDNIFKNNPSGFAVVIQKKIKVSTGKTVSWVKNPLAISAILIPPPCPKTIRGKGTVIDVIVEDPGNGYPVPPPPDLPPEQPGYPVALKLKTVEIITPGINYNCGEDELVIEPSNGAELEYKCDTFGRISQVIVSNPGFGFTSTPTITMKGKGGEPTPGVNATFRPQFEVIRDPIVVDRDKLIQVTDLVGLKQTGYVDGRAYYGAVFYKDGVRFAGYYETAGQLVQVYDTLQESIDATVTTPASAIERSGTDVTSNDPRLDIPNTPDELI
tara:strand:+ start:16 stop:4689 length:4674 start_codon:yes stop_codon:yes gene_type:complete